MEGRILRGDLAPDLGVAPPRVSLTREHPLNADGNRGEKSVSSQEQGFSRKKRRLAASKKVVPWATRSDRSCGKECTHADAYCIFPTFKDGQPYAVPIILRQPGDLVEVLDPNGSVIPLKAKGGKPRIQEGVEKLGCDTAVFASLTATNTGWYRMLFTMEHREPDNNTPEAWKCVRRGSTASLYFQPVLPADTNDMDESWRGALGAAKELFDRLHTDTATTAGTEGETAAVTAMSSLAATTPLLGAGSAPSTSQGAASTRVLDFGTDGQNARDATPSALVDIHRRLEKRLEDRVTEATDKAMAQHRLDMVQLQDELETERDLTRSLKGQLGAIQKECRAREEVATQLKERMEALMDEKTLLGSKHDALEASLHKAQQELNRSLSEEDMQSARVEGYEKCLQFLTESIKDMS